MQGSLEILTLPVPHRYPECMANILIVDDQLSVQDMISRLLEQAGHKTWSAGSYDEALSLVGSLQLDLVITDLVMPEKPGLDLVAWLRKKKRRLPVIVISGYLSPQSQSTIDDLLKRGVKKIVSKPFDGETLLAAVRDTLPDPRG
jgi:CheY-like chemotaxis protein